MVLRMSVHIMYIYIYIVDYIYVYILCVYVHDLPRKEQTGNVCLSFEIRFDNKMIKEDWAKQCGHNVSTCKRCEIKTTLPKKQVLRVKPNQNIELSFRILIYASTCVLCFPFVCPILSKICVMFLNVIYVGVFLYVPICFNIYSIFPFKMWEIFFVVLII